MQRRKLEDFEVFYMEIPQPTDYLERIDPEIQDAHEPSGESERGLSSEQVSELARDALKDLDPDAKTGATEDTQSTIK